MEKIITSKLLKPGANKKIATVDRHVGIVSSPIRLPHTIAIVINRRNSNS